MGFIVNLVKTGARWAGFKFVEELVKSLVGRGKPPIEPIREQEIRKLERELEICRKDLDRCVSENQELIERLDEMERRLQFMWFWAAIATVSTIVLAIILLWR